VWKIFLNKKQEKRVFIFFGLFLFFLIFTNNRVLDYFPLAYLYVSLIALISRGQRSRFDVPKRSRKVAYRNDIHPLESPG